MALQYPGEWKFASPEEIGSMPNALVGYFHDLLVKVAAAHSSQKGMIETFKARFGKIHASTSLDWALTDLYEAMQESAPNCAAFLDALWASLEDAKTENLATPSESQVNDVLRRNNVPFQIRAPELLRVASDAHVSNQAEPLASTQGKHTYQLGQQIGRGGFGEVFLVTRETSAATFQYAMKRLSPSAFTGNLEKATQRFRREVKAMQALQHRGIVQYVDAGTDDEGRLFVVMPYIQGKNIRDATEGKSPRWSLHLIAEVLLALEYAHSQQVLHRDLKPSNILVRDSDAQPIILDFGTAFIASEMQEQPLTSTALGSTGYVPAEEIADPRRRSPLRDVFAVAVIAYEILCRKLPNPQDYDPVARQVPAGAKLDPILQQAMGPISRRHPSAVALRDDILAAVASIA